MHKPLLILNSIKFTSDQEKKICYCFNNMFFSVVFSIPIASIRNDGIEFFSTWEQHEIKLRKVEILKKVSPQNSEKLKKVKTVAFNNAEVYQYQD